MKRGQFIKNIIGLFGLSVLPVSLFRQYQNIYLLQSFIRGFQYYEGPKLLAQMHEGDLLELVREPHNPHDGYAIALHFNQHRIGYLPRENNEIVSRLLDANAVELHAEITHLNKAAASWENVSVAIYLLKEWKESLPDYALYLTQLETPHYRSLQYAGKKTARVYYDDTGEDITDADDWYEALVENSKDDGIYDIIHNGFGSGEVMNDAVQQSKIVINRKRLPADLQIDEVVKAIDNTVVALDEAFDDKGFVVANVNRLATLSYRLSSFQQVADAKGQIFYEAILKS